MPWEKQFDVEDVLDKAVNAFWSRGYEATSMQDLVDCTGVNRASLYATWGDKRSLFMAALVSYDEKWRRLLFARLEARYKPLEAIRRLFQANVNPVLAGGESRGCFMANTALELAAHDPEIGSIVAAAQVEMEAFFFRNIERGKAMALIDPTIDSRVVSRGLLSSLLGVLVLVRSRPEPALLKDVIREALRKLEA